MCVCVCVCVCMEVNHGNTSGRMNKIEKQINPKLMNFL